jgi:hypothetical protein
MQLAGDAPLAAYVVPIGCWPEDPEPVARPTRRSRRPGSIAFLALPPKASNRHRREYWRR